LNLANILTLIGIVSTIVGGVYFAEDRYAKAVVVASLNKDVNTKIVNIQEMLPSKYTKIKNFYTYRLTTESRWVSYELIGANRELENLKSHSATLTPNQRIYARNTEQRIGRLLNQQKEIDHELSSLKTMP